SADDDAVVLLGGFDREDVALDVFEHPLGWPLQGVAEAAAAGMEEEDLPALPHPEAGAVDAEARLLVRPGRVDDPGAGSVLAAGVAPRPEAFTVAEAREDGVALGEVPDLRHPGGAAVVPGAERVGLEPVGVEHEREE